MWSLWELMSKAFTNNKGWCVAYTHRRSSSIMYSHYGNNMSIALHSLSAAMAWADIPPAWQP